MNWVHEFSTRFTSDPARVFRALILEDELRRWFAEQVEVEPTVGGRYRFWGRHTLGVPTKEEADQRILRLEAGRVLSYSWRLFGVPTEVTISLAASPGASEASDPRTSVALHHTCERALGQLRERDLIDDYWRLTLGNLGAHLSGGALLRPDLADPFPEVRCSIVIDAPAAAVFRALIDPDALNRWIATGAFVEPRVGGRFEFGWNYRVDGRDVVGGPTRILELVPDRRLVIDWPDWRGNPSVPTQKISFDLEPVGAQTRVTLVHSGFMRAADISDYPFGWGQYLEQLGPVAAALA